MMFPGGVTAKKVPPRGGGAAGKGKAANKGKSKSGKNNSTNTAAAAPDLNAMLAQIETSAAAAAPGGPADPFKDNGKKGMNKQQWMRLIDRFVVDPEQHREAVSALLSQQGNHRDYAVENYFINCETEDMLDPAHVKGDPLTPNEQVNMLMRGNAPHKSWIGNFVLKKNPPALLDHTKEHLVATAEACIKGRDKNACKNLMNSLLVAEQQADSENKLIMQARKHAEEEAKQNKSDPPTDEIQLIKIPDLFYEILDSVSEQYFARLGEFHSELSETLRTNKLVGLSLCLSSLATETPSSTSNSNSKDSIPSSTSVSNLAGGGLGGAGPESNSLIGCITEFRGQKSMLKEGSKTWEFAKWKLPKCSRFLRGLFATASVSHQTDIIGEKLEEGGSDCVGDLLKTCSLKIFHNAYMTRSIAKSEGVSKVKEENQETGFIPCSIRQYRESGICGEIKRYIGEIHPHYDLFYGAISDYLKKHGSFFYGERPPSAIYRIVCEESWVELEAGCVEKIEGVVDDLDRGICDNSQELVDYFKTELRNFSDPVSFS